MKCHFVLFYIFSTILVSTHSFEMALKELRDGLALSTSSDTDTMNSSETSMDDTVPVLSQPEILMSTVPMRTETAVPSQMIATDPLMTDAAPSQIMTDNTAEGTISKPAVTTEEARSREWSQTTASGVLKRIYDECVQHGSFACVKPKVLSFLSAAVKQDKIFLTDDLVIEKAGRVMEAYEFEQPQKWDGSNSMRADVLLEKIDSFLGNHELKLRVPKDIISGELLPYIPKFLLQNIPAEIRLPLSDSKPVGQERGIIKKVVIPFLLGLKFKATALVPLALALIALKTWKALTLGLLSIVLSGAMVIFKFTKPKVVNYEVYHYPAAAPVIEHPAPTYEHQGWSRSMDAQPLAYRAYVPL